jgi:hypothetical protein
VAPAGATPTTRNDPAEAGPTFAGPGLSPNDSVDAPFGGVRGKRAPVGSLYGSVKGPPVPRLRGVLRDHVGVCVCELRVTVTRNDPPKRGRNTRLYPTEPAVGAPHR